jgi:biopolymer transport protein TolR
MDVAKKKSTKHRARPVMNVTPLVDVVLVLLIIFMVVIPAMQQAINVEIPGITNVDEKAENAGQPFILSVTKEGLVYLEEDQLPPNQITPRLTAARRREPNRRLVLRGDKGTSYGQVRSLYRVVQNVGFPGVSLRVNQRQDEKQK